MIGQATGKYFRPALHILRRFFGIHTKAGGNYSEVWREWITKNRLTATPDKVKAFGDEILKRFRIDGYPSPVVPIVCGPCIDILMKQLPPPPGGTVPS